MNKLIFLLTALLVCSLAFGQKKSKEDPKDEQINKLTLQLDSVTKELAKYSGVYHAFKDKVIHYNFDPTRAGYLIDSILSPQDSLFRIRLKAYGDTVSNLIKENKSLKAAIDSSHNIVVRNREEMNQAELERERTVYALKQLKELLDHKIITEAEYVVLKKKYLEKL